MFKHNAAILGFWAMVALAQVLGFGVSRPLRSLYARLWVWPITAASAFALEWYIAWSIPARQSLEAGLAEERTTSELRAGEMRASAATPAHGTASIARCSRACACASLHTCLEACSPRMRRPRPAHRMVWRSSSPGSFCAARA
jgi:hypothetical protein